MRSSESLTFVDRRLQEVGEFVRCGAFGAMELTCCAITCHFPPVLPPHLLPLSLNIWRLTF
jgi:hypothetical protein